MSKVAGAKGLVDIIRLLGRGLGAGAKTSGRFAGRIAKYGTAGILLKGGLGYIESLIDQKIAEAALQDMGLGGPPDAILSPFSSDKEAPLKLIKLSDIITAVDIDPKQIVPVLGPDTGPYAIHLNLIIERVASLESAVSNQAKLIAKLEGSIGKYNDTERRVRLEKKRKDKEKDIEGKSWIRGVGSTVLNKGKNVGRNLASIIKPFLLPVAALALATAGYLEEDEKEKTGEGYIEKVTGQKIETVGDAFEAALGVVDKVEAFILTPAFVAMTKTQELAAAGTKVAKNIRDAATGIAMQGVMTVDSFKTAVKSNSTFAAVAGKFGNTQKTAKASKFIAGLDKASAFFRWIASKAGSILSAVGGLLSKIPKKILDLVKWTGKSVVKWYFIIQALEAIRRNVWAWLTDSLTEEMFHTENKKQINTIIKTLGPTWALTTIGLMTGPAALVAAPTGFIVGLFFGEKIYDMINFEKVVSIFYDMIVWGVTEGIPALWKGIKAIFDKEFYKMIGNTIKDVGKDIADTVVDLSNTTIEGAKQSFENVKLAVSDGIETAITKTLSIFKKGDDSLESMRIITTDAMVVASNAAASIYQKLMGDDSITSTGMQDETVKISNEESYERNIELINEQVKDGVITEETARVRIEAIQYAQGIKDTKTITATPARTQTTKIVPVMIPMLQQQSNRTSYNAGNAPASVVESARPSFNTRDSYLDYGLIT
jgi:hypothetical protein